MSSTQKSSFSSAKRVLATAASAAMIFALLPAGIAMGESPDNVCPPPDGAETFPDVDTGVHADNIECAAGYDIVQGYPDGEYKPELDVFRAQMATFIVNTIEAARGEAMPAGEDAFDDDETSVHEENINKLAEAGIVQGQAGDYNPARKVNRAAMATFIANAIDYVDDQDPDNNSVLPAAAADHFTDDETSPHEENINRLADAGIVEGQDSATSYNPGNIVFRGQMASFVIESASVLEDEGLWEANDVAPTTNQELPITPSDAAENTVDDSRQYSVSGLDDATDYDIFLFPAENVTVDENDVVTFADSTGDANEADWTATDADITVVNGTTATDSNGSVLDVSPVNGTITFTIKSSTADTVRPVIIVADVNSTDADPDLDLDADDKPTEDFGVGGSKKWIPKEAAQGRIGTTGTVTTDEDINEVDKDANRIITEDATYYYDSNDTFYVVDGETGDADTTACNPATLDSSKQVTMSGFEDQLSKGDQLDEDTVYQSDEALSSRFCLENIAPATPTVSVASTKDTTVTFTVTNKATGATVNAYCGVNDDDAFDKSEDVLRKQTTTDEDANTAGFQIIATGLSPTTSYDCFITQTVDDDESSASTRQDVTTTSTADAAKPTIQNAVVTTDSGLQGVVDSGDVWTLTFSEGMHNSTSANGEFLLEDADGDQYLVDCDQTNNTTAACSLSNNDTTAGNETLTITITAATATDRNSGTGDNTAEYPSTIITTNDQVKDTSGNVVDLAASADVVVDKE